MGTVHKTLAVAGKMESSQTMISTLISLIVLVLVVGIVLYLVQLLLALVPMDERFKKIAWVLILLIAVLIVLAKVLPLLGVSMSL